MKDLEWKTVFNRHVALVPSKPYACGFNQIRCPFNGKLCIVDGAVACGTKDDVYLMFITKDQLSEYLAQRLTDQS